MSAHTPGPLTAEFVEMGGYDCMTDAWQIEDGAGRVLARLDLADYGQPHCERFQSPEADANAALIASAPELLEAVINFLAWIDGPDIEWGGVPETPEVTALRAAIAKAEGR